jgi:L-ribulose-5-phosphate 3-epimerase
MKIGCRAHDYGKHPAQELALILHNAGYQAAQVAVPKAIEGINDYQHISPEQLETLRSGFSAHQVEISVLGCYQDLSDPDAEKRAAAVQNVCRVLGWQHLAGGHCVGSETSYLHLDAEERALISLFYNEEKTIGEIALILGLTESNAKVKLHRIRKKLYILITEAE